jgi:hypothetical protein
MTMTRMRLFRILFYGGAGLVLLHPYTRQSLFGPGINGVPFWSWQQRYREAADPSEYDDSVLTKAARLVGIKAQEREYDWPEPAEMLPVVLSLLADPDAGVRGLSANALSRIDPKSYPERKGEH